MKRLIAMLMIVAMVCALCGGCAASAATEDDTIGYVIVPHYDGDEHIAITSYYTSNGTIVVRTMDGRKIVGTELVVVVEDN
jgi:ABC-type glycerol-3-phosphate transport system substrate-binding protein